MADDFDQTQALFLDEFEQDTDEDDQKDKRPVAHLKVACQKGFPETTFPLYEGNNVIGRHEESCSVCIPLKALSREHACIEIKGDSFLIFDKSSRNKTKRNKLYLTPEVRYELKNGDTLIFGDVEGKFVIGSQMDDDGSETGSESEYQTANDKDVTVELDEEEYDSDNSVDLLQPTQAYHTKKTGKSLIADDSLLEKESTVLVTETPGPKKKEIRTCPVIEDSGSETEDETSKNVPPTLVLNEESDVEESLLSGPTQAFTDFRVNEPTQTFVAESDTEDEDSKKKILQYAATQAYLEDESVIQDTQETKDDEIEESEEEDVSHLFTSSTLACDIDDFPSDQQVVMADETAEFEQETLAVMAEATQAVTGCDPTLVVTGDDATQAVTGDDATQAVSGEDATQVVSGDDATQAVSGDVPTLVVTGDDVTQAVTGDDATQAVSGDVPTLVVTGDDETQAVTGDDATQAVSGDDATQAVSGDDATQAVSGDDTTQAISEDIGSHANTTQRDSAKQGVTGEEDVGATQVFPEEAATEYELDERVQGRPLVDIPTTASEECASVVNLVAVTEKMEVVGQTETMAVDATLVIQDAVIEGKKSKGRGRQKELPKDSTETNSEGKGGQIGKSVLQSDQADSSSQETDDGSVRRSGRAKRKSFRMVEMEESMDDMKGIDKSIRRGEDYSPEPEADSPKKSSGKKGNQTKLDQDFVADPVPHSDPNVTPLPSDVIEKTETQFLKTLPALQGKDAPQVKENIQVGTMDTDLPKPGMEEATQAYSLDVEDTILSNEGDRDEGDITPPIEDVLAATQPYSMEEEVIADSEEIDKPALISIPSRSPLKPAIRSPEKKRDKSPSPKRVQFAVKKTPSSSTTGSENSEAGAEAKSPTTNEIKAALVKKVIMRRKEEANEDEAIEKTQATTRGRRGKKVEPTAESENREAYLKEKPATTRGRKRKSTTVTNNVEPVDNKAEEIEEKTTTTRGQKRKSTTVTNNVEPVDNKAEEIEEKPTTTRGQKRKSTTVTNNVEPVDNKAGEMEEKNTDPVPETSGISDASENTMLTGVVAAAEEKMSAGNSTIEKSPKISVEEKAAEETVKEKTVGDSVKEKSAEETVPVETEVENKNKRTAGRRSNVGKRQARGKKSSNKDEGKEAHVSNEADENEAKINEINDVETNEKKELKVGVKGRSRVSTAKTNITIDKDEDNKISETLASSSKEVVIEAVETSRPVGRRGKGAKKNSAIINSTIKNDTLSTLDNEGNDSTSTSQDIQIEEPKQSRRSKVSSPTKHDINSDEPKHSRRSEVSSPTKHDINSDEPNHSRRSNNSASSSQDIHSEEPKRSRRSKNLGPATQDVHSDEPKRNRRSNDSASASQDNHSDEPKDSRRSKDLSPAKQDNESDQPKSSRQSRSSVSSSQESVQSGKEVKTTKSVKKGKILKNDEESANDTENTEMQNESRASRSTRRGHHGDVKNNSKPEVSEQSADIVDTSNVNDTIEKPVKRRGRTKVGQNDKHETDSESSQNSKTSQRSSSQPPNKSQSQPTGRRGRMSVQPVSNNKNDEAMQPPKTVGRRGKTDTQSDKTTFNSSSQRSSRQTRTTMNDNETVESESIKDDSSESSQDKDFVTDAKSVGNKRKRDSSVSSNGRKSQATKRTKTEDDDPEISGGADGKDTTKTTSRKRAREQESQESPVKKKEPKVETPKRSSTVGVSSPSLRRKSVDPSKPKVLFTGVIDEHGQKVIKDLGGDVASSVNECTHLVTDKIRRTVKFLCCLARGIPIVTLQWIESCKQSAMFVDCNKFAVKDSATEKQYKFSLSRSLEKARDASLLQGYKIHVTKSVKPEPSQMAEIITCAGGEYLTSMPKKGGDNIVIISCADDSSLCKVAVKAGIPVVSSEFILTGILKQETSIKQYTLNSEEEINTSIRGRR